MPSPPDLHRRLFHPLVADWFDETFGTPTPVQTQGWESIYAGDDTLLAAPTGSGKTFAAFACAIDRLVRLSVADHLEEKTYVLYVSPLKALGNDIAKTLQQPLRGVQEMAKNSPYTVPQIRHGVRTGDTPTKDRQRHLKRPPHIFVTTPESLYILLTAEKSRAILDQVETVIVDEIHAVAGDKRGLHLALTLERLDALVGKKVQRIGLSATQRPISEIARLLVGQDRCIHSTPQCAIVDVGHKRELDLSVATPDIELGPIASHEIRDETYDRLVRLVETHRTTIVFANTRRLVERVAHALSERLGKDKVVAHHGSMSRTARLSAEENLKNGLVPVIVATASLELGIDVGHVDLVCHLGAPRSLAALLQRVGRSGHFLGAVPKGIIFPFTRDDLVQSAAAVWAVRAGHLDRIQVPENALDILAQQIVALVASHDEVTEEFVWSLVRKAYPYHTLQKEDFDAVLRMLADGVSTRRGRRSAHIHFDRVNKILRPRRGARLAAITCGGAIPDVADYRVIQEPNETFVGTVNEDFAIESLAGDIFLLGNSSWRIRRVENGRIRVVDAQGAPPSIPFWLGEAPARTYELSNAVSSLREAVAGQLPDNAAAQHWLIKEIGLTEWGARQITEYIFDTVAILGAVPTGERMVVERFFDEAGGMQLVIHSPLGGRINRALGLALRKRFCVSFDFELQAAATDDGVVISLGEQHSFPLESVFSMVSSNTVKADLVQAALQSPMFTNRWRWNSTRALALLRHAGGKRVPMPLQRMRADDLLAAVFPEQAACGDNHPGPVELPAHPLVDETISNCLFEAMDFPGLKRLLENVRSGSTETVVAETPNPSPMSHEILNANPYAFLDDAPLEERRARAVSLRRVDPTIANGIGALDQNAIDEVKNQAWPEVRSAEELHDLLLTLCIYPTQEMPPSWTSYVGELSGSGRLCLFETSTSKSFVAPTERLEVASVVYQCELSAAVAVEESDYGGSEEPVVQIIRGWMECLGPISGEELSTKLEIPLSKVNAALFRLESLGTVLRGVFRSGRSGVEWCDRGLLSRIHRRTIQGLRKSIEPVSPAHFMRFLFKWQHLEKGTQLHAEAGIREVLSLFQGLELPGPSWEETILPSRVLNYDPEDLERLCLAGEVMWGRLGLIDEKTVLGRGRTQTRATPLGFFLRENVEELVRGVPSSRAGSALTQKAQEVFGFLKEEGASFVYEIGKAVGRLPAEVEQALWELVRNGLVTGDGVAGLRSLLTPAAKRGGHKSGRRRVSDPKKLGRQKLQTGRWSVLKRFDEEQRGGENLQAFWVEQLLLRYGIVFRDLLVKEKHGPSWRDLLPRLRQLEGQGQVRGGRFVSGFVGEQFAVPAAVDTMRAINRKEDAGNIVLVHSADPLNLVGIITPGKRLSPLAGDVIAYRDGVPLAIGELGQVRSALQTDPGFRRQTSKLYARAS